MLQSAMRPQLARLKYRYFKEGIMYKETSLLGPMVNHLDAAEIELNDMRRHSNHFICRGNRSVALAATILHRNEIIAVPTDTIYGLAGIVSSTSSIQNLYKIKQRDQNKPLSISVNDVGAIEKWAIVDHLPLNMLSLMLPGPYTVILKRTPELNPALNPNHDTVGVRVPNLEFIRNVSDIVGPLALTSANMSNKPSTVFPLEFKDLWPKLGGIFYNSWNYGETLKNRTKQASTIVDLSIPEYYKIERYGIGSKELITFLEQYGLRQYKHCCDTQSDTQTSGSLFCQTN